MQSTMDKFLSHFFHFLSSRLSVWVAVALCLAVFAPAAGAQEFSYGIDPARDSAAFAAFRVRMDSVRRERPVVALVLSGGGAKGAAQIPVLKYLDSIGLRPDMIVGTSIGGLVGGLYACGYSGKELEELFLNMAWDTMIRDLASNRYDNLHVKDFDSRCQLSFAFGKRMGDFVTGRRREGDIRRSLLGSGVCQGQNISNLLASLTAAHGDECNFLDLPIPFVCVASDMVSARPKVWHSGDLVTAMRSSMTIPGLFSLVKTHDMVLLDGSLRSNFPVEVARAMGADTVIGVDISSPPLKAEEINTLMDIIYQTTDVMGRETYDAAITGTDIYIRPDLHGFSLLSFGQNDIATIMQRGSDELKKHTTRLKKLAPDQRSTLNAQRSNHLDTLSIARVSFVGIDEGAERYLRHLLHLGDRLTARDIQDAVEMMMGTKAFENVTYRILGPRPPYILQFSCLPAATGVLGVGVRFDSYEMGAILLHAGLNTHSLTGHKATLEGRLGQRSQLSGGYSFHTRQGVNLGVDASIEYMRHGSFIVDSHTYQSSHLHNRADAFAEFMPWRQVAFRTGAMIDQWHLYTLLDDNDNLNHSHNLNSQLFASLFARIRTDTWDDPYFPTRGVKGDLLGHLFFHEIQGPTPFFYTLSGNISAAIPVGRLTILPSLATRYVSLDVIPYMNALSVTASSRILEQQIPFVGLGEATFCGRMLSTAGITLRMNVIGKHHVSLLAQALHQSDELYSHFLADRSSSALGLGLEYAYQSPAGPLRLIAHWSTIDHTFGLLLNLGVDF